ncbi:lactonase family protein [Nocardiopsis metallicus]|uniref:6-phosphogluconolactonase (Cycloisomerase 2 family) n=1 Tax=Nocardiopsis metallicus TaxID=179819 RepID=A0A840WF98_9ACTN|nr:lactonase family protein [Nocardiopsis metallicus]MBB5495650.1 6-phosphogluconolactonase (cycloisomerase 2 family) [Nocardiopsis metallicus]
MDTPRRLLLVGTYTPDSDPPGEGQGIHRVWFDPETGELTADGAAAHTTGPSFLAFRPEPPTVYAVNEQAKGTVTAFRVHGDASLTELGSVPTGGGSPCHVRYLGPEQVAVANYANGVVAFQPTADDGTPTGPARELPHRGRGPVSERQEGPHAHSTAIALDSHEPRLRYLLAADLGTDELRVYHYATPLSPENEGPAPEIEDGLLSTVPLPSGTGPRHMAVNGGYVYVAGELDSRVHTVRWNPRNGTGEHLGSLPALGAHTAAVTEANYPGEITLHRLKVEGREIADGDALPMTNTYEGRVYVSNRGADVISTFAVRDEGARLEHLADTPVGAWPRHFTVVRGHNGQPDHLVAAAQNGDSLMSLLIDPDTGVPADTGHRLEIAVPVCVLPVPIKRIRRAEAAEAVAEEAVR